MEKSKVNLIQTNNCALAVFDYDSLPPAPFLPYGSEQSAFTLCKGLEDIGEFSTIDYFQDNLAPALHLIRNVSNFNSDLPFLADIFNRRNKYSAIYLPHGLLRKCPYGLRLLDDPTPIVVEVGTTHHPNIWRNLLYAALCGTLRYSDGFIFKSERTRTAFLNIWENWMGHFPTITPFPQCTTIPNAVDCSKNERNTDLRVTIRSELGIDESSVLFLVFCRFAPISKLDFFSLFHLWEKVVERNSNAILIISGAMISSPDYRQYPQDLHLHARSCGISKNVIILPNPFERWPNAKTALMSAADVFIHTTRGMEETCPNVILEAMSHELPVIASDWSGIEGMIDPGITGWLIETWSVPLETVARQALFSKSHQTIISEMEAAVGIDALQFLNAVEKCMITSLRTEVGKNGREKAVSTFSVDIISRSRAKFIKKISKLSLNNISSCKNIIPLVDLDIIVNSLSKNKVNDSTMISFLYNSDESIRIKSSEFKTVLGTEFIALMRTRGEVSFRDIYETLAVNTNPSKITRATIGELVIKAFNMGIIHLSENIPNDE